MKFATTAALAFVALALGVMSSVVAAQSHPPIFTGNGLLSRAEASERTADGRSFGTDAQMGSQWLGFIAGVAWTLQDIDPKTCLPEGATTGQVSAVVLQYLRQNPAQLHRNSHILVREALRKAFPCR